MSKRLQVLVEESELDAIRRAAADAGQTVSEWARQALREHARRGRSGGDPSRKLAVVQAGTAHSYPTAELDEMLVQIESGYLGRPPS